MRKRQLYKVAFKLPLNNINNNNSQLNNKQLKLNKHKIHNKKKLFIFLHTELLYQLNNPHDNRFFLIFFF